MIPAREIGCGCGRLGFSVTPGFVVDMTHYPAEFELGFHQHEHANLCLVLEGAFTEWTGCRERLCQAGTLIAKPRSETHRDRFHGLGARCVNVAVDHERLAQIQDAFSALVENRIESHPSLLVSGHRLSAELSRPDELSPLVVEGLVLEIIAGTVRSSVRQRGALADWVAQARDYLHERFRESVSLADVARAVQRHPVTVAQQFRARFRVSVGEYVRRLRVDHVARRLVTSRESLASLAAEAGFTDQSHMQRTFKACLGQTPAAFRRSRA
jgi:AraC family transcriptional regulator